MMVAPVREVIKFAGFTLFTALMSAVDMKFVVRNGEAFNVAHFANTTVLVYIFEFNVSIYLFNV